MAKPLESEFKIIIPREKKKAIKNALSKMSRRFGGATEILVRGVWENPKTKKLVKDENVLLFSTRDLDGKSPKILVKDRKFMDKLAGEIVRQTGEDEIMVEEDIIRSVDFIKLGGVV